jgi:mRNA interferase MazF
MTPSTPKTLPLRQNIETTKILKKSISANPSTSSGRTGEIGENIGYEQNGKGEIFSRPVVIVKRFSRNMFFGIPLSTQLKEGNFFFEFELSGVKSNTLVVQDRLFDVKRLENKIGMMNKNDFEKLKVRVRELLNV